MTSQKINIEYEHILSTAEFWTTAAELKRLLQLAARADVGLRRYLNDHPGHAKLMFAQMSQTTQALRHLTRAMRDYEQSRKGESTE